MMDNPAPDAPQPAGKRVRRLRAVFAADMANFGGLVSVDETNTLDALWATRRIAREELAAHGGWLFGMPGDGIFALFESAVDAVRCALETQARLAAMTKFDAVRMRIGIHLGDVLFHDDLPFGETLVIAARLESLADPGGILVSAAVMEAVAPRISATFGEKGVFDLKHSPRRITTFSVSMPPSATDMNATVSRIEPLDRTVFSVAPARPEEWNGPASPPPPVPEARALSLPKAAPLVVPSHPMDAAPAPVEDPAPDVPRSSPPMDSAASEACLADIAHALTIYLGPVAGLLVKRHATQMTDLAALVEDLAREIPAREERLQFLSRAQQLVARRRH
ncbi:adenylate/guanylate cyclase domain-containing protein [Microvirga lotononidis]|uniref:Family 3 adenylate cyclase n=1 Tax=Microvirga lotononidis TaxID=864069 RepID=I4YKX2_9HYPH|nr:adenylate/guanylate cyclase domain-containing protein [Microvirga lotononidis]EIM24614.1 family 3 adenylate cyclase [Microvirga lotononidis]WQO26629.1 adenylate/guanylate cyclase domain-containing protein [Microvirga lotononidis]